MQKGNIYEGVTGLVIDIPIYDKKGLQVPYDIISYCRLDVLVPGGSKTPINWPATAVEPNLLRHVVGPDENLKAGNYYIQPYIETLDGFTGPTTPIIMPVLAKFTL
jgi:hypothetical protein